MTKVASFLDYHQLPFLELEGELREAKNFSHFVPAIRKVDFNAQPGAYSSEDSRCLLGDFIDRAESLLKELIERHSLAYWLHLSRRIPIHPFTDNADPTTLTLTRSILESAFQKYAQPTYCNSIGFTGEVPLNRILNGFFGRHGSDSKIVSALGLDKPGMLVLIDIKASNLAEFYAVEKVALLLWRLGAKLRLVGKGAGIIITEDHGLTDDRSPELDRLVRSFDARLHAFGASSKGVAFGSVSGQDEGSLIVPRYNVGDSESTGVHTLAAILGIEIVGKPDFLFMPSVLDLRGYYLSHKPLAKAFEAKHHVSYKAVVFVLTSLIGSCLSTVESNSSQMFRLFLRGYLGPCTVAQAEELVVDHLPLAELVLGDQAPEWCQIEGAVRFLTADAQSRLNIEVKLHGPMSVFLPVNEKTWFIDFAYIGEVLFHLFYGVRLSDENFKGTLLENALQIPGAPLKFRILKAGGQQIEIDGSWAVGDCLVILEAKAVERSVAFERGDPQAIAHRTTQVVDRALKEVDKKAQWLAENPVGDNFDVARFTSVVGIGVSPFVEFIPSEDDRYWLSNDLPRVLSVVEAMELIRDEPRTSSTRTFKNSYRVRAKERGDD